MSPHFTLGKVTCQKVCQPLAPRVSAACSCSVPVACITGINSRATKGNVTKSVASTIPGTAKIILSGCEDSQTRCHVKPSADHQGNERCGWLSHSPKNPCMPNNTTNISPATTGEIENGKSINVMSSD